MCILKKTVDDDDGGDCSPDDDLRVALGSVGTGPSTVVGRVAFDTLSKIPDFRYAINSRAILTLPSCCFHLLLNPRGTCLFF